MSSGLRMSGTLARRPLVAVIGATGTGKSELAVELATRFNGEIINGDAMQLYDGLPIITNKITQDERKGIPHHLLGCIGLSEETWTVGTFVQKALGVIDEIHARGRLPILVGGTHYYTQSLLFQDALAAPIKEDGAEPCGSVGQNPDLSILEAPTSIILEKLREVDPVMADRWHPNDRRKIQRSLEIWLKTGKPASQVYEAQSQQKKWKSFSLETSMCSGMRFPTLLLWVHASTESLRARLDSRVGRMVAAGLLDEVATLETFLREQDSAGTPVDRTRGIWVSIGYKEFANYQAALNELSQEGASEEALTNLSQIMADAISKTKTATRHYAKRQIRWIRIKLVHAIRDAQAAGNLFLLDGSDLPQWETNVLDPAFSLVSSFLTEEKLPDPSSLSLPAAEMLVPRRDFDMATSREHWLRKTCEICNMTFVTESAWEQHLTSRGHRRACRDKRKREEKSTEEAISSAACSINNTSPDIESHGDLVRLLESTAGESQDH